MENIMRNVQAGRVVGEEIMILVETKEKSNEYRQVTLVKKDVEFRDSLSNTTFREENGKPVIYISSSNYKKLFS